MQSYYDRATQAHLDGSPIFKTAQDGRNEVEVARLVEAAFRCKLHSYGCLSPVDWWAERDGRVVATLELKSRTHDSKKYGTVFLNHRKWLALTFSQLAFGQPSIFVVRFTDAVLYVPLSGIGAGRLVVGGCRAIVKSRNDREPVIEVDVKDMKPLPAAGGQHGSDRADLRRVDEVDQAELAPRVGAVHPAHREPPDGSEDIEGRL